MQNLTQTAIWVTQGSDPTAPALASQESERLWALQGWENPVKWDSCNLVEMLWSQLQWDCFSRSWSTTGKPCWPSSKCDWFLAAKEASGWGREEVSQSHEKQGAWGPSKVFQTPLEVSMKLYCEIGKMTKQHCHGSLVSSIPDKCYTTNVIPSSLLPVVYLPAFLRTDSTTSKGLCGEAVGTEPHASCPYSVVPVSCPRGLSAGWFPTIAQNHRCLESSVQTAVGEVGVEKIFSTSREAERMTK